jgi:hypothetical protein
MRRTAALAGLLGMLFLGGCRRYRPATAADCSALYDRIFALEFAESGFRDPVLAARKHDALAVRFAPDIRACTGARLAAGALQCAHGAPSAEEVSHRCLR